MFKVFEKKTEFIPSKNSNKFQNEPKPNQKLIDSKVSNLKVDKNNKDLAPAKFLAYIEFINKVKHIQILLSFFKG